MQYLTSDLHFNHDNILKFCRTEFSDVLTMNEELVKTWNDNVSHDDTVFNLGDLAFKTSDKRQETITILDRLKGKHILIKGNHDSDKHISHFTKLSQYHRNLMINIGGIEFLLSHFPFQEFMREKDKKERQYCFTEKVYKDGKLIPLLHGHTHEAYTIRPNQLCVCWDIFHRPISELEILKIYYDTNGFTENLEKYNQTKF